MLLRIALTLSLLLCVAAATGSAQVRRPPRTRTGALTPTTPPPPTPALAAFTLSLDSISGGPGPYQPNGKITMSAVAPAGGLAVTLSSDNPAASVPANLSLAAGASEATFPIATTVVSVPTMVRITARAGTTTFTDSLKLLLSIVSVVAPNTSPANYATRGPWHVTMSGPAPATGIRVMAQLVGVSGGSSHACYPLPQFTAANIAAGQTTGIVTAQAGPSMYRVWNWEAKYGGRSSPGLAFGVGPPGLSSIDFPATLVSGTTGSGFVRLQAPTPSYGCATSPQFASWYDQLYVFYFSSNSPAVQVPSSARVDPAQSERSLIISAATVQTPQTATITVSKRSSTGPLVAIKQVTITVTP